MDLEIVDTNINPKADSSCLWKHLEKLWVSAKKVLIINILKGSQSRFLIGKVLNAHGRKQNLHQWLGAVALTQCPGKNKFLFANSEMQNHLLGSCVNYCPS